MKLKNMFILLVAILLATTNSLFADKKDLGEYIASSNPVTTTSPCPGGGKSTTTSHTDYYTHGYVNVVVNSNCDPDPSTTTRDTIITGGIAKIVDVNVVNGDIIAEVSTGSIEVYDVRFAQEGNPYSTPIIGAYASNGFNAIAKNVPRNIPLVIIVKDEYGNVIATQKLLINK